MDRIILGFAEFVESGEKFGFTGSRQRFGTMGVEQKAGSMFLLAGFASVNVRQKKRRGRIFGLMKGGVNVSASHICTV